MDIILLESLNKLGRAGEIVTVKDGFAKNFLIPEKKAIIANKKNKADLKNRITQINSNNDKKIVEANEIKEKYRKDLVHSTASVLFENNTRGPDKYFGRDEYFNSVIVQSNEDLTGKIRKVKIDKCNQNTLFGEVVLEDKPKEFAA